MRAGVHKSEFHWQMAKSVGGHLLYKQRQRVKKKNAEHRPLPLPSPQIRPLSREQWLKCCSFGGSKRWHLIAPLPDRMQWISVKPQCGIKLTQRHCCQACAAQIPLPQNLKKNPLATCLVCEQVMQMLRGENCYTQMHSQRGIEWGGNGLL